MKWIFEGMVYSSLEELSGKTMSEGNKPEPVFSLEEMKDCALNMANWADGYEYALTPNEYFINRYGISIVETPYKLIKEFGICDPIYNVYLSRGDRGMPLAMYEAMNEKVDVGEGAESESEL